MYASGNTAYYNYAQTIDGMYLIAILFFCFNFVLGKLYSWGRSKLAVLGNGLLPTGVQAVYNGDFSVPIPTRVDPLKIGYTFEQNAFTCVQNPSADYCEQPIPMYAKQNGFELVF